MAKAKKPKIDKKVKKLKKALRKADKKSRKVEQSDVPRISQDPSLDLI